MPISNPLKSWQFSVNTPLRSTGTALSDQRRILRSIKSLLLGFASSPWVVDYSCDGAVAGAPGDGVDRWGADAGLVWSAGAHSWIVLRQPGLGSGFRLLIDLSGAAASASVVAVFSAVAGFIGGTVTARPTAVDEVVVNTGARAHTLGAGPFDAVLHAMQSTDGQCTRVVAHDGVTGAAGLTLVLDRAAFPVTNWLTPVVVGWFGGGAGVGGMTAELATASAVLRGAHAATTLRLHATCESFGGVASTRQFDDADLSGERLAYPIGLASLDVGTYGRHGELFDAWWGGARAPVGETFGGLARTHCRLVGDLILPWNGTSPVVHL